MDRSDHLSVPAGQGRHGHEEVAAERGAVHVAVVGAAVCEQAGERAIGRQPAVAVHERRAAAADERGGFAAQSAGRAAAHRDDAPLHVDHEDHLVAARDRLCPEARLRGIHRPCPLPTCTHGKVYRPESLPA
jgi:hypothetical protein